MKESLDNFWAVHTDRQIFEAVHQYLYQKYGFEKNTKPKLIEHQLLKHIYYAVHVLEVLINQGWGYFESSIWNTDDFYKAIGYFDSRFLQEIEKYIAYFDPTDDFDNVRDYVIDTKILLRFNMSEAIRIHQKEFEPILEDLKVIIKENIERRDSIRIEEWKEQY